MAKRYVTNDTPNMIYVGGKMIPPGEGREVEELDEAPPQVDEPAPDLDADLRELLKGSVAAVAGALGGIGAETLTRLQALENEAAKPRKGVLEALANAQIALADEKLKGDDLREDLSGDAGDGTQAPQ